MAMAASLHLLLLSPPNLTPNSLLPPLRTSIKTTYKYSKPCPSQFSSSSINPSYRAGRNPRFVCRAAEYKFPDPIPEFAQAVRLPHFLLYTWLLWLNISSSFICMYVQEIEKFRSHLITKFSKKQELFGDSVEEVVAVCTEVPPPSYYSFPCPIHHLNFDITSLKNIVDSSHTFIAFSFCSPSVNCMDS